MMPHLVSVLLSLFNLSQQFQWDATVISMAAITLNARPSTTSRLDMCERHRHGAQAQT